MTNNNILEEYFIWEEKSLTDHNTNSTKKEESVNESSINETKTDLTQTDWRDITDPKLRRKMRMQIYNKTYHEANKNKNKLRSKSHYEANKDKIKLRSKHWREANKEKSKSYNKVYRESNRDEVLLYKKTYRETNKDKVRLQKKAWHEANKERLRVDMQYKLKRRLRSRLHHALNGNYKNGSAVKDLGCTVDELKLYLESKFQPGMTWDNWGQYGWHVDHIRPLASFDLTDRRQLLEACHYTNLQPLWATDNLSKGARQPCKPQQPSHDHPQV